MRKTKRIDSLDFLRALSVLFIITYHFYFNASQTGLYKEKSGFINLIGEIGVSFFIIISGASLFLVYEKKINIISFFQKRALSIFPQFWTAYIFVSVFLFIFFNTHTFGGDLSTLSLSVIGMDGYIGNSYIKLNTPVYYLVGEWFTGFILIIYILFPLIRFFFIKNSTLTFASSVAIAILANKYNHEIGNHIPILNKNPVCNPLARMPEFIFGMMFMRSVIKKSQDNKLYLLTALGYSVFSFKFIPNTETSISSYPLTMAIFVIVYHLVIYINPFKLTPFKVAINFISQNSYMMILIHHQVINFMSQRIDIKSLSNATILAYLLVVILATSVISKKLNNIASSLSHKISRN